MLNDKVKLTKLDNKQLRRKAVRTLQSGAQLNLRLCIFILLFLITVILIVQANRKLYDQPKHLSLNQYVRHFFNDPYESPFKNDSLANEPDYIWGEETIQLFQDQLGIIVESDSETEKAKSCRVGREFAVTALPGVVDDDLGDVLWQYLSLIALESQTIEFDNDGEKLTLKAFITEQMRAKMDQLFEGLPLRTLSNLPSTCYNLKYARIIGNKSPIILSKISHLDSPLLLDPKAKRVKEIAQLFGSKMRPFLSLKREVLEEVRQELLVTKTIQEVEPTREMDVKFVGVYIRADDKLTLEYYERSMAFHRKNERTIFMVICDVESLTFCQESFNGPKAAGDARILRKSVDIFDFALMTSCNSTIVSNDMGLLHALINGGDTTVHRPEATADPEYNTSWLLSVNLPNWYAID